jgi:hypothetical protein
MIGAKMRFKIWISKNNRAGVFKVWKADTRPVLDHLPLDYDDITIKTLEQIDVLWLKGRAIVRAFDVDHTISIYSGILRMAYLLAFQSNMNFILCIVAPLERRTKALQELLGRVFSLRDWAPLFERCTYISYYSVDEVVNQKRILHLTNSVLNENAEEAQ